MKTQKYKITFFFCFLLTGYSVLSAATPSSPYFKLVVLPDTQIYAHDRPDWRASSRKEVFVQQTTWIKENVPKENIKFVLHMGDIVHLQRHLYHWTNANEAMSILDGVVPYCFTVGNHDLVMDTKEGSGIVRDSTNYNKTFPYTRYEKEPWFGGRMKNDGFPPADNYDNSYHFFQAEGMEFMIVTLEVGPTDEMLAWANQVVAAHRDKRVLVLTHSYLEGNGTRVTQDPYIPVNPGNVGEQIWEKFVKKHANIFFVLCGHHNNLPDHRGLLASKGTGGNTVYQLISGEDYDGWLRLLRFRPRENKIEVKTYSPWRPQENQPQYQQYDFSLPAANADPYHQYELSYDMSNRLNACQAVKIE